MKGKDYNGRYADYEVEYELHVEACKKAKVEPEKKVRKRGGFHAITPTCSIPKQIEQLACGRAKVGPRLPLSPARRCLGSCPPVSLNPDGA